MQLFLKGSNLRCRLPPFVYILFEFFKNLLFFISDSTLFFVRFKKDGRLKTHFWVMLTYSIGELLIVSGLI